MNSASSIKCKTRELARRYQVALHRHLTQEAATNLDLAARLGRLAVTLELETLDLALIHEEALIIETAPIPAFVDRDRVIRRAGAFFAAAILPMEETHRTALAANANLTRLNQTLNQRTQALAASNRRLKREVTR